MPHDVFVSHSAQDKPIADAVVAALEADGVRCWIAPRDILPGSNYMASLVHALRGASIVVLVMSGMANSSPHVQRELQHAVETGTPIIPFKIDSAEPTGALSYALIGTHWLDAMTPTLEDALGDLTRSVRALLDVRPPAGGGAGEQPGTPGGQVSDVEPPVSPPALRRQRASDVVIVAAAYAYPAWQRYGVYVCQASRPFRASVTHFGFYADGEVKPELAEVLFDAGDWQWTEQALADLESQHGEEGAELARRMRVMLADENDRWNQVNRTYLLSSPDDERTIHLPTSIANDLTNEDGRRYAYTQGQRYSTIDDLRRVAESGKGTSKL
jgi:hypothetical protein